MTNFTNKFDFYNRTLAERKFCNVPLYIKDSSAKTWTLPVVS